MGKLHKTEPTEAGSEHSRAAEGRKQVMRTLLSRLHMPGDKLERVDCESSLTMRQLLRDELDTAAHVVFILILSLKAKAISAKTIVPSGGNYLCNRLRSFYLLDVTRLMFYLALSIPCAVKSGCSSGTVGGHQGQRFGAAGDTEVRSPRKGV